MKFSISGEILVHRREPLLYVCQPRNGRNGPIKGQSPPSNNAFKLSQWYGERAVGISPWSTEASETKGLKVELDMDIILVVLAGGRSTRFGLLSATLPKSALPVYDECTLVRNVRQAQAAGFEEIVVSTRASFVEPVSGLLGAQNLLGQGPSVRVIANEHHESGPLPALLRVLNNLDADRVALSLSDIFFIENAYLSLYKHSQLHDNYLAVADPFDPLELSKGGIVLSDAELCIHSILEKPVAGNTEGVRWTGLAVFDRQLESHLEAFLAAGEVTAPIGNFFEHYLRKGHELRAFRVSDFINVNTPNDMFLASMYRALELHCANDGLRQRLSEVTSSVRLRLLQGQDERPDTSFQRVERLSSTA